MSKKRKEVVKPIEDAAALIKDGQTVAIGGFGADNHPMAIVREIIRSSKKNLTIVASATAGLEIDLLIGADCVKKLIAPYVGQELYCPIGHNFRKYAESGEVEIYRPRSDLLFSLEYRRTKTFSIYDYSASAGQVNLGMGILF